MVAVVIPAVCLSISTTFGQTTLQQPMVQVPLAASFAAPAVAAPRETAAFGLSGAVRMVVTTTEAELDASILERAGSGWEQGYRWARLDAQGPRVLGVPAEAPPPGPLFPFLNSIVTPAESGAWRLESGTGSAVTVVTQVPASEKRGGHLNGYHIGVYPTEGSDRSDVYAPPTGFIEVFPVTTDLQVSQHLTIGQFLTKDQFDVWPKYVALDFRLIDKLELVVQELRAMGVRAHRIHVMSGFRTPQYNGPGGDGRAELSRHMWGDAADVWIDDDGDGRIDDLNGDGITDMNDAIVMMRAVDRVEHRYPALVGGAGVYPETAAHGPYIHIDARGHHSRW
jgi:hypothetical protein